MSPFAPRGTRRPAVAAVALSASVLLFGCASANDQPNAATSASVAPGPVPHLGQATQGTISVTGVSIVRTGQTLRITAQIHNAGTAADELLAIGSQVSPTVALSPAVKVPAGGTAKLGRGGTPASLQQEARLEPEGTVALTLQFQHAGSIEVFSSFQ